MEYLKKINLHRTACWVSQAFARLSERTASTDKARMHALLRSMEYLSLGARHASYAQTVDLLEYAAGQMFKIVASNRQNHPELLESCAGHLDSIVTTIHSVPNQSNQLQVKLCLVVSHQARCKVSSR